MNRNTSRALIISAAILLSLSGRLLAQDVPAAGAEEHIKKSEEHSRRVSSTKKIEVGWVERMDIYPEKLRFDAKLTPGSEGNILHAQNIKKFKKGKSTWVKFKVTDKKGKSMTLSREVVDTMKFRTTDGKLEERYQVMVDFCIASKYFHLEFALADRSDFEHEVRIGRDALAGHFLINPGRVRTTVPSCSESEIAHSEKRSGE